MPNSSPCAYQIPLGYPFEDHIHTLHYRKVHTSFDPLHNRWQKPSRPPVSSGWVDRFAPVVPGVNTPRRQTRSFPARSLIWALWLCCVAVGRTFLGRIPYPLAINQVLGSQNVRYSMTCTNRTHNMRWASIGYITTKIIRRIDLVHNELLSGIIKHELCARVYIIKNFFTRIGY